METTKLDNLKIEGEKGTYFVPHVDFSAETGRCVLEGESYLENTWEFYKQLVSWLRAYAETNQPIYFDFKLTYFNTSSSKGILEVLELFEGVSRSGRND